MSWPASLMVFSMSPTVAPLKIVPRGPGKGKGKPMPTPTVTHSRTHSGRSEPEQVDPEEALDVLVIISSSVPRGSSMTLPKTV